MSNIDRGLHFTFEKKAQAEEFCVRLRKLAYKCDVVTLNDILIDRGEPMIPEGFHYGYSRADTKKLKPEKEGSCWQVRFPAPGRMVRDPNGYWTTEPCPDLSKGE